MLTSVPSVIIVYDYLDMQDRVSYTSTQKILVNQYIFEELDVRTTSATGKGRTKRSVAAR